MIMAGLLRHRVTVQTPVQTVDSVGRRSTALVRGGTIAASVEAVAASESNYADGVALRTSYQIRVRAASAAQNGLTSSSVLEYGDRTLQVVGIVREREESDVVVITATEVA